MEPKSLLVSEEAATVSGIQSLRACEEAGSVSNNNIYIYIFFYIAHIKSLKNAATQNNGLGFLRPSASDLRSVFGLRPVEPEVSWFLKKQRLSLESKVSLPAKEQGASQIIYLYIYMYIYKAC